MAEDLRQPAMAAQPSHVQSLRPAEGPALRVALDDVQLRDAVSSAAGSSAAAWRIVSADAPADAAVVDLAAAETVGALRQMGMVVIAVRGAPDEATQASAGLLADDGVDIAAADAGEIVVRLTRLRRAAGLARAHASTQAELADVQEHMRRLTYSVSHDLKEPLRAITGFSRLLETRHEEALDEQARTYLAFVSDGANRLEAMLAALLQFSRLGRQEIDRRPVDVGSLVHRAMRDLEAPGGVISVDGPLPDLVTDQSMLSAIIVALLDNALKFSASTAKPSVIVSGGMNGGEWWLSVRDNGAGFITTDPRRVFSMFSRLHTREQFSGIGAGLALADLAATRLDGGIAYVVDEQGTTFTLRLPAPIGDADEADVTG